MNNQTIRLDNEAYFTLVRQRLDAGNEVRIPVVGKSMEPFLRERDEVLLQKAKGTDVAVGDVVLARWELRYVLHRVVKKKAGELWLAGDNNLMQTEKVPFADLIAVMREARRSGKRLSASGAFNKNLGIFWYYLRLPRRAIVAIKRRYRLFFTRN